MRLLLAGLFFTLALAGCLSGTDGNGEPDMPMATIVCDPACNIQATVEPERQANELSIAVNPLDSNNIIASGKDYFPSEAGDCVRDGVYVTLDGGVTWNNANVPGSPWGLLDDPASVSEPGAVHPELTKFWCVTDPVLAFGPDGTVYWTIMPYQCDAASGSKTGDGVHPQGGFNDWFWTCSSMYVLVSEDGGLTWPTVREVAFGPRLEHDKQWMSVAPDGTVLLCWDRDPNYQAVGLLDNPAAQLSQPGYMVCSTSTDKGQTWSPVTDVNPPGTSWDGFLPWVDWGPDNTAWMAGIDSAGNVFVSHSEDGLVWGDPTMVGTYEFPPANGSFGWPALNGSIFRTFALPTLAVDRSSGPFSGSVYVMWMDHSTGNAEVMFTYSRDGTTFSDPVRIGDDNPADGHDQFMPVVSVGPDGTVDAMWYDRRDDPNMHLIDTYYAYSLTGGESWSPDLRITDASFDEQYSHHQNGMVFLGDYNDMDSDCGHAYPVWVDTRNMKADVYIAKIARPGVTEC